MSVLPQNAVIGLSREELGEALSPLRLERYRAGQIFDWLHKKRVSSYEEMSNLPAQLRRTLAEDMPFSYPEAVSRRESEKDGTVKYLLSYPDGALVESVLMHYRHGTSLCLSSQVGCRMACRFCASGILGKERNLLAGEMLEEVYAVSALEGERLSNIVIMGTGEPLDNYDEVVRFVRRVTDPEGNGLGGRQVALSTCGIVPNILRLAEEKLPLALALSLHAVRDSLRHELMPGTRAWTVRETVEAMRSYAILTGRRVTFEYILIRGLNDTEEDAQELARLVRGIPHLVNLIPVNPVAERGFCRPDAAETAAFKKMLEKCGINVTIRREMGSDVEGACGQLRRRRMEKLKAGPST